MSVIGRTITGFDYESPGDYDIEDRGYPMVVLHLDNGDKVFAMRDDEGNGPGVLMHRVVDGITRDEYIE
ncbi:MAG: hypothetical protein LC650_00395 [Actinobacteria bacterium]|nr:hypothetical protein [Actinomycetota bacterium]